MVYVSWGPGNKVNFAINGGGISKSRTAGGFPTARARTRRSSSGPARVAAGR